MKTTEQIFKTACALDCPDTCSMLVTVVDGRVTRLQGDPNHPLTRGFLCHKVAHYDRRLYSPLRILQPLRRTGEKGKGKFAPISWDEALDEISSHWKKIIAEEGGEAILPYSYGGSLGVVQRLVGHRLFYRMGASQLLRTICDPAAMAGWDITIGKAVSTDMQVAAASDFILIWGMNVAATSVHFVPIIKQARAQGAQVVLVDPCRNRTTHLADRQVMPLPGTDAALALGIMRVLIEENLTDQNYIERHTLGFEALRERVMKQYPLQRVSRITSVPVNEIVELARAYGSAKGPFLRAGFAFTRHAHGAMAMRTIACLPGLVGAFEKPGGGAHHETAGAFEFNFDRITGADRFSPKTRQINMVKLGDALLNLTSPRVRSLYVYNCNPAAVAPDQSRVHAGLKREDLFTVVHEQVHNDTVDFADIVLPAPTFLEYLDLYKSYGHYQLQMGKPVVEPLGQAKPNLEVFWLLARRMGFSDACFDDDEYAVMEQALDSASPYLQNIDFDRLKNGDPQRLHVDSNPFAGGFFTPSGKLEFYSETLASQGLDPLPVYDGISRNGGDMEGDRYALRLINPPSVHFLNTTFGAVESQRLRMKRPEIKINPGDASRRGIQNGSLVRVYNGLGECRLHAVVTCDVIPGVVAAEANWWPSHMHNKAGLNVLMSSRLTDLGGGSTLQGNRVEVARLADGDCTPRPSGADAPRD